MSSVHRHRSPAGPARAGFAGRYWIVVVGLIGLAATLTFWHWARVGEEEEAREEFVHYADAFTYEFRETISDYERLLTLARGTLHADSDHPMTAARWRRLMGDTDLLHSYPGLHGVAYLTHLPARDVPRLAARLRSEGQPGFEVRNPGMGTERLVVTYVEPFFTGVDKVIGLDYTGEPRRQALAQRARDSGQAAVSQPLVLIDNPDSGASHLMALAFYRDGIPASVTDRQRDFRGLVVAVFRVDELMNAIIGRRFPGLAISIEAEGSIIATKSEDHALLGVAPYEQRVDRGGFSWQLRMRPTADFDAYTDHRRSVLVVNLGLAGTALLILMVWYFIKGRERALVQAGTTARELESSQERFRLAMEATRDGLWDLNLADKTYAVSAALEDMLAMPVSWGRTMTTRAALDLIHPDDVARCRELMRAHLLHGTPYSIELRVRHEDGHYIWVWSRGKVVRDERGRPLRMVGSVTDIDREREEEERLAKHQAFLLRIVDILPEPISVKDTDLRFVIVNRAFADMVGLPADQIIGKRAADLFAADQAEAMERQERYAMAVDGLFSGEMLIRDHAGGESRSKQMIAVRGSGPEGEPLVIGIQHDITELRQALARFEVAVETTPLAAIVSLDRTGKVLSWNRESERLYGIGVNRAIGIWAQDLFQSPLARSRFNSVLAQVFATGKASDVAEIHLRLVNGVERWVLSTMVPVKIGDEVVEAYTMTIDITARKKSEAALLASEERFRHLSAMASDWFWEQDDQFRFTYFSDAVHQHDINVSNVIGRTRWELPIMLSDADWRSHRRDLERHQPFYDLEYRIRDDSGNFRWFSVSGEPLFAGTGHFIGYRGTSRDITERKRIDEELRDHRDRLQELVEEQTQSLVRAKEAAEQANQAKSEFLANMSHELRTPMHAILSFARLGDAKAGSVPAEKLHDYFKRIEASGERLLELVNDLLDLSKLEAGKMVLERETMDLMPVVRDVVHELEPLLLSRQQTVSLPGEPHAWVYGDQRRLGQVVRNLLSNAIRYSPEGTRIQIELAPESLPGGRRTGDEGMMPAIRLTVADEGVGVPAEELEAVFEKFRQSSRTSSGAGGTGLGLAICREIVAAHRGKITARNRPEGGAAFDVLLPTQTTQR